MRNMAGMHYIIWSDTNHYQKLVNSKFLFQVYKFCSNFKHCRINFLPKLTVEFIKKAKASEKSSRVPSTKRYITRFIANTLLFSVVGNTFRSGTETSKWNQVSCYFANFPQVQHFLDKNDKLLIC